MGVAKMKRDLKCLSSVNRFTFQLIILKVNEKPTNTKWRKSEKNLTKEELLKV